MILIDWFQIVGAREKGWLFIGWFEFFRTNFRRFEQFAFFQGIECSARWEATGKELKFWLLLVMCVCVWVCVCECVCVSVCVWVWGGVETMNQSEKKTNSKFLISFVTSPTQPILQNPLLLRQPSIVSSLPAPVVRTPITVSLRHFQNYVISEGRGLKRQRGGGGWDKEIHQRGGGVEILNILPSIQHSPVPSVSSIWLKIFSNCSLHQKACSFKYQKCYTFGLSHYPNSCFYVTTGVFFFSKVST